MPKKKSHTSPILRPSTIVPLLVVGAVLVYVVFMDTPKETPIDRSVSSRATSSEVIEKEIKKPDPTPPLPSPEPISDLSSTAMILSSSGTTVQSSSGAILSSTGTTDYFNTSLKYGFSLPRWSYYAGFGARDGAAHSVGIVSGTGVTTFEESQVRVWFYPSKYLTELSRSEGGFYQDPRSNMTYLKLGRGTIRIEWDMESPVVLLLIETVRREQDEE